ncbi:mediator of RNA polymerase II transcription subunit 27-like isoform X1 [Zingiber officinale]|uniref:mediator of RNA polymerase II transcription subunit 27-like isoform X1 n=1 Tax=Zingiber officinale TaxID=94328 RepID=UPI001C4B1B6E|nr:mediator of RNA polymerase II transcription subunit 27-like isoform X1 [Zingiber officinale]
MMAQFQQSITAGTAVATTQSQDLMESNGEVSSQAPPKQVALAMERLASAARIIADIRLGADRLLEALLLSADDPQQSIDRVAQLLRKEDTSMRQHFNDLRGLGNQLEASGVLNGSTKLRGNSWGLHMPLVCPDGAVVAYAWKRQLAGQAGASAVDRTRLALKAFTDQKKRFFPHLEDEVSGDGEPENAKKWLDSQGSVRTRKADHKEKMSLFDVLKDLECEFPNIRIFTYQRLDWSKRASSLSSIVSENSDSFKNQSLNHSSYTSAGVSNVAAVDQAAVIELLVPFIFRAVVSLHPAGSITPDALAFFSTDEGGNYMHSRGVSVHHVFRHVTENADRALQYFLSVESNHSLTVLLRWICSHQTLFSKTCSKCGRLLRMDKSLALLLPPVHRAFWEMSAANSSQMKLAPDSVSAYHIGCSADEF